MVRTRLLIGSALLVALAAIVWIDERIGQPTVLLVVAVLFGVLASVEFLRLFSVKTRAVSILCGLAALPAILLPIFCGDLTFEQACLWILIAQGIIALLHVTASLQRHGPDAARNCLRDYGIGIIAVLYCLVPIGLLIDLAMTSGRGSLFVIVLILVVKCADIGGYLGGTAFGRRRVLPAVSPKKSYEGSFCGLALTIAASFLVAHYWPGLLLDSSAAVIITLAVALNLASQAGDFTESALKRVLGVKDSAQLLPTFGGALDMMDSLVIAVPVAAVAFRIWS